MRTIRVFEERVHREFATGAIPGFVHLSAGQESAAVAVCMQLRTRDQVTTSHRGHGHCIAKGLDVKTMMAELYGKATGVCGGMAGSMHIADPSCGLMGANAIVGSQASMACGAALAAKTLKTGVIAVSFIGDGGSNAGQFLEALNLAAICELPVVFVVENNGYAETTSSSWAIGGGDLVRRAEGFGVVGASADGSDFLAVYEAARCAIERARARSHPSLLEVRCHRFFGHFEGDTQTYRAPGEIEQVRAARDPIVALAAEMLEAGRITRRALDDIDAAAGRLIDEAVAFAMAGTAPTYAQLFENVYCAYP